MENNLDKKFCPKCGSSNHIRNEFCSECGYSFKERTDGRAVITPVKKKRSGTIISIIVCIFIVLIGAGLYLYLEINSNKMGVYVTPTTPAIQATPVPTPTPTVQPTSTPAFNTESESAYADGGDIRSQYILYGSDKEIIDTKVFQHLNARDLELARNEIYARHGRQFLTEYIQQYFNSCPWYKINPNYNYDNEDSMLTPIELENVKIIVAEENRRKVN